MVENSTKMILQKQMDYLFKSGANIVDIGGESTRPGSKSKVRKLNGRIKIF